MPEATYHDILAAQRKHHGVVTPFRSVGLESPTRPMLIGLGGYKESGKDAAADFLAEEFGFTVLGMSNALHEHLMVLNPIVGYAPNDTRLQTYQQAFEMYGYVGMKRISEVRRLQQVYGTEVGRGLIDGDIWATQTASAVQPLLDAGRRVVVTGIRFENEFDMIDRLGGTNVWVRRPGIVGSDHPSEAGIPTRDFPHTLHNDGTLEDLRHTVRRMTRALDRAAGRSPEIMGE